MANRKKQSSRRELWDGEDFEDINSHSSGERPQYEWFTQRQKLKEEARQAARAEERANHRGNRSSPAKDKPGRKRARGEKEKTAAKRRPAKRKPEARRDSRSQRATERPGDQSRKRKKPMSLFKRRLLIVLGIAAMLAVTLFLAESLLLRVTDVWVEGDMVYPQEEILNICKFRAGDNLLFLPVRDREEKLVDQLPYVAEAKITRRIPGSVIITITAAQPGCCIETGGVWLVVSGAGKILASQPQPQEKLLQVTGLSPKTTQPGEMVEVEDEVVSQAFQQIVKKVASLGASQEFTRLDLTNLADIRLWYQDRVECVLGSTEELEYKVQYACELFQNDQDRGIGPEENGTLDLSFLPETKTSYFTAGANSPPKQVSPTPSPTPSPEPISSEEEAGNEYDPGTETGNEPDFEEGNGDYEDTGDDEWVEPEGEDEEWFEPEDNGEDGGDYEYIDEYGGEEE